MGVTLVFADSFAHYNDTALKWSTGGGVFDTTPARVRTGPQSLRIQAGNSPSINNFEFPVDTAGGAFGFVTTLNQFAVGFAWQTQSLAGETVCELWTKLAGGQLSVPLVPAQRQFLLVQNANGSISIFTGNDPTPTLIGTTAAGVLTVGPFWYIELSVDMVGNALLLTVTNASGVASVVLTASGYTTSQPNIDALLWGGPSGGNSAWVADFYVGAWDGIGPAVPTVIGAPKIYGLSVPKADGQERLATQPGVTLPPFDVTAAPFWPQVSAIPQNTASFMERDPYLGNYPAPFGQGFEFDVSSVPIASTVAALQINMLISEAEAGVGQGVPIASVLRAFTGDPLPPFDSGVKNGIVNGPFLFYPFPFNLNPSSGAPWTVAEFSGPTAMQLGPFFSLPG